MDAVCPKLQKSAAESWLRSLLDTMSCNRSCQVGWRVRKAEVGVGMDGVRDREGIRDKEYAVVQGVWLRAGLGVGRIGVRVGCGTGGLGVWGGQGLGLGWGTGRFGGETRK